MANAKNEEEQRKRIWFVIQKEGESQEYLVELKDEHLPPEKHHRAIRERRLSLKEIGDDEAWKNRFYEVFPLPCRGTTCLWCDQGKRSPHEKLRVRDKPSTFYPLSVEDLSSQKDAVLMLTHSQFETLLAYFNYDVDLPVRVRLRAETIEEVLRGHQTRRVELTVGSAEGGV